MAKDKKIKIVAFVGPSGTGKSHRAQMVAKNKGIEYIIDDAILINQNRLVAGTSAKRASTKIEAVKRALFSAEGQALRPRSCGQGYRWVHLQTQPAAC